MRQSRIVVLCLISVLFVFSSASEVWCAENEMGQVTCTGKVIDEQDRPVPDAKIELYQIGVDPGILSYKLKLIQEKMTDDNGHFEIISGISDDDFVDQAIILVEKEGMALGWANWQLSENSNVEITLRPPKLLAGKVVDEDGNPINDAEVGISFMLDQTGGKPRYLVGHMSLKFLTVRSGSDGKFSFSRIPSGASAEFVVKKPGRATISTFDPQNFRGTTLQFTTGQTDIQITQPIEAKIEGVAVEKASGKPIGNVQMMAMRGFNQPTFGLEPVTSEEDGTFRIDGLAQGEYFLQIVTPMGETAEWITEPMKVLTEAGKSKSGVKVELIKGGVLEVLVTDSTNKQPVDKATVSIQPVRGGTGTAGRTDENGIARTRLLPGEYRITFLYKQGYSRQRLQEDIITIEEGKTVHIEHQLAGMPKMAGVVRDDQGQPIEGTRLKICPMSGQDAVSDAQGKFEVSWDPGNWYSSEPPLMILLARHLERNLAAVVEVDENIRTVDVTLKAGVSFIGRVMDSDGKGIANAPLLVMLKGPRWSSSIENNIATDSEGHFEIKALAPENRYSIEASAVGYGRSLKEADTGEAVDNRLDIEPFTLVVADLSVSGVVVDTDDKPVAGVNVYCYGENQPQSVRAQTDADGKFTLEKLCAGKIRINANKIGATQMYGTIETEGGATGVKVVIRPTSARYEPKQPPSMIGKSLSDMKEFGVDLSPDDIKGKRVLICFWDMQQRPSRHSLTQLAKQAPAIKAKGFVIVAVQVSKIDQNEFDGWVKKSNIPFSVGMIQGDEEKARFTWGVRSLPWLILTDTNHVVVSQGFRLEDLNNQLGQDGR